MDKQNLGEKARQDYISYIDLLGVGDASTSLGSSYLEQLHEFRLALCEAVDLKLIEADKVYAFSDCAFASSSSLQRMGEFLSHVQRLMWEKDIFLKGGLALGESEHYPFAQLKGETESLTAERQKKLKGEFFHKGFVKPALMEKNLKGIAIEVDNSIVDAAWLKANTLTTGCLINETAMRVVPVRSLSIPAEDLSSLENILKISMRANHKSKKIGRYYIPLIINWVKNHDYSYADVEYDLGKMEFKNIKQNDPITQLILSPKVTSEVSSWAGGDAVFYALLSSVERDCDGPVVDKLVEFIATNEQLCNSADSIPYSICSEKLQKSVIDTNIKLTFKQTKTAP